MANDIILGTAPLGFPWKTPDPFLFCVHHYDAYPPGKEDFGPDASLAGRNIGSDFEGRDGWRMYHGDVVPGFPYHPHRGFETVTLVRRGLIDHADSLGAVARFGQGDVQWVTAGKGILHSEMFPLLDKSAGNTMELFQIWLNLPPESKLVDPYFSMLWADQIPIRNYRDEVGRKTTVKVVAGRLNDATAPAPPPDSWAAREENDVAIWTITMQPGAEWVIPPAQPGSNRYLYFFQGESVEVGGTNLEGNMAIDLRGDREVPLRNGAGEGDFLLLQGKPIGQPVVQYGPFVMNSEAEIRQAFADYQATQFGGWPWPTPGPVHGAEPVRFAKYGDGTVERAV